MAKLTSPCREGCRRHPDPAPRALSRGRAGLDRPAGPRRGSGGRRGRRRPRRGDARGRRAPRRALPRPRRAARPERRAQHRAARHRRAARVLRRRRRRGAPGLARCPAGRRGGLPDEVAVLDRPDPRPLRGPPLPRRAGARARRSPSSTSAPPIATATTRGAPTWRSAAARSSASGPSTRRASSTATSRSGRRACGPPAAAIRYVADAALDHRRAGDDARLRALCRAAYRRGLASRRFDVFKGTAPSLAGELRVLAGCLLHGPRRACMQRPGARRALARASARRPGGAAPAPAPPRTSCRAPAERSAAGAAPCCARATRWLDVREAPRRARLRRAARREPPRRRVLAVGIDRPGALMDAARAELMRSRHAVEIAHRPAGRARQVREPQRAARRASAGAVRLAAGDRRRRRAAARLPRRVPAAPPSARA